MGFVRGSSHKTGIDDLAAAVMEGLEEYRDDVRIRMKEAVHDTALSVKDELKRTSPRRKSSSGRNYKTGNGVKAYHREWTATTREETASRLYMAVVNFNKYRLTHLLEYGHAKRSGGRTAAQPHIEPAEQNGIAMLEAEIERSLKRG